MLLNALEAFIRELLYAGGDCALQADGTWPGLPSEEAKAADKQYEEGGGDLLTWTPAMPHMPKDTHL